MPAQKNLRIQRRPPGKLHARQPQRIASACHGQSPVQYHTRLAVPDWYVSGLMLDRALDAILHRVRLDRRHDVPYLAGYSQDGATIYIDRHLPRILMLRGRKIEVDRYLVLHETVEKTLIDQLGLHYQHAHQIALRAEEAAVLGDHIGWSTYDRFMQRYIKRIGDERLVRVPKDLDLKPYRDEHDRELMGRMKRAINSGRLPLPGRSATRKRGAKRR